MKVNICGLPHEVVEMENNFNLDCQLGMIEYKDLVIKINKNMPQIAKDETLYMCNNCHNMAIKPVDRIHDNTVAEKLSKMLGQAIYERDYIVLNKCTGEEARGAFMARYGRNYL